MDGLRCKTQLVINQVHSNSVKLFGTGRKIKAGNDNESCSYPAKTEKTPAQPGDIEFFQNYSMFGVKNFYHI